VYAQNEEAYEEFGLGRLLDTKKRRIKPFMDYEDRLRNLAKARRVRKQMAEQQSNGTPEKKGGGWRKYLQEKASYAGQKAAYYTKKFTPSRTAAKHSVAQAKREGTWLAKVSGLSKPKKVGSRRIVVQYQQPAPSPYYAPPGYYPQPGYPPQQQAPVRKQRKTRQPRQSSGLDGWFSSGTSKGFF
jgi:hypothetical protein